jgi:hypothetical protein
MEATEEMAHKALNVIMKPINNYLHVVFSCIIHLYLHVTQVLNSVVFPLKKASI